ncbi:phosphotransferase enzyme family protein [Candidatus Glomeribacter gigasporarum]|uniref:phosphotransferase enzyme family protein n=1 Tax=Candidatus Glomeribacter gigasporarum TaxID=132144 RepID=UPI0002E6E398|nr:phosphotransferase [Candidatus Glomeribacter gigasporarum]
MFVSIKECSKDRVPSFCPSLTLKETRAVLDRFPQLGCVKTWIWRRRNPYYAASGIVLASGGPVFIKRHSSSVRNAHALMQEHRFIAHLRAAQLPVCEVLVDASGACAIDCGHWVYEVHRAMPGIDLYRDAFFWTPFVSVAHARAAGQALAQLHLAARGYTAPARRTQILVGRFGIFASADPLAQLDALIRNCPSLARLLARRRWRAAAHKRLLPFHARLYPLLQTLETLWTHNDWHASNLLWSSARAPVRVSAILDFGLSDRSYALCDLAIAIERNIIGWRAQPYVHSGSIDWDALHAFLDGYESLKPLTEAEAHALPRLLPLAHAEFALSEMAYFSSVADAPEQAALTYERYFLGHADWFNGCAGQALIACLERRAARANTAYALY